jgi:toxin ParE1/3/4
VNISIVFLPAARREIIEAQDWYERAASGLGRQFRAEVDRQVERIMSRPSQFPVLHAGVRRARLRRFPYGLFFRLRPEMIQVIACFHSSRDPMVWQSRFAPD